MLVAVLRVIRGRRVPLMRMSLALTQPLARFAAAALDFAVLGVARLVGKDVLEATHG